MNKKTSPSPEWEIPKVDWQELIDIVQGMIDRDTNRKGKNE